MKIKVGDIFTGSIYPKIEKGGIAARQRRCYDTQTGGRGTETKTTLPRIVLAVQKPISLVDGNPIALYIGMKAQ